MRNIKKYIDDHLDKDKHDRIKLSPVGLALLMENLEMDVIQDQLRSYKGIPITIVQDYGLNVKLCKKRNSKLFTRKLQKS